MSSSPRDLLVIGAGMAAAYLVQELARLPRNWRITVVGDEPEACYNRVLLSSLLAGETAEQELSLLETRPGLHIITGCHIETIDWDIGVARGHDGRELPFDHLVFATGAAAALPQLNGLQAEGVAVLRTLADCRQLRARGPGAAQAVVVGGGLLGLEAAHGLNRLGCETTVVHRQEYLMNRQLDPRGAAYLESALTATGLHFVMEDEIKAISLQKTGSLERGAVRAVTLASGRELPCDLLVFATGIQPSTALARDAGIEVERGIMVDGQMRASRPDVWALGECSQMGEHCFGLVAPVREQARVLARALCGSAGPDFQPGRYPAQLKISGVDIFSDGDLSEPAEELVLEDPAGGVYRRLRLRDRRLVGAVLVGDKQGATWYSELIRKSVDISAVRPVLMFGPKLCQSIGPSTDGGTARAA